MIRAEQETATKAAQEATRTDPASLPLLDFVPVVSPELARPAHLTRLADALERATREPTRLVISVPPQHGKSTLVFHWLAWALQRDARECLYITYSADFALSQMRIAKPIAERSGVEFPTSSRALCEWQTVRGGRLWATGIGGSITGRPGGLIVVDDPIKDWAEAQSRGVRDATDQWFRSAVLTRAHPNTSVIVVHTRWHEDDLGGRLEREGWETVNVPAIGEDGAALWPEQRPIAFLEQQRAEVGEHIFAALYQGRPRPRGGSVFEGVWYAETPPPTYRAAIGLDLAYSAKTHADRSTSVVAARFGEHTYVLDCVIKQVRAPEFGMVLKSHASQYPGAPMRWYCSGTEQGIADFFGTLGIHIDALPATRDKFTRAQPVAAAWNAGKILLPRGAPWVDALVAEVLGFTGVNDPHDDIVDALAAAFDALGSQITSAGSGTGRGSEARAWSDVL